MNRHKSTGSLSSIGSLTASSTSLNSKNAEMEDLKKRLHIKESQLNEFYEMAPDDASNLVTKEQVVYALKVINLAKQHVPDDEIKEVCDNLNDYGICVTYLAANSRKSSAEILKVLSPYLLKNVSNLDYVKQYILQEYIKKSNQSDAMELLAKPELKEYLEQKFAKLTVKSSYDEEPTTPTTEQDVKAIVEEPTTPTTAQDVKAVVEEPITSTTEQNIKVIGEDPTAPVMVEVTGEGSTVAAA